MWRPNYARAAALGLGACCVLLCAPAHAGRVVQDGVLQDGVPAASAQVSAGMARFASGSEARLLDWLSDGSLLVVTGEGGRDQLQRWSGDPPRPQALGAPALPLRTAAAQPFHDDWVAALASSPDAATADDAALWLDALDGSAPKLLLEAAAHPGAPVWAHDGRRLAFSATLRAGESSDLYMLDTGASAGPRLIASGDAGAWQVLAWTSADRSLLVRHTASDRGDELLLVDVDSGAMRRVDAQPTATAGYVRIGEARLAPDDRGIYLITDRGSDHDQLQYIDLYANSTIELPADFSHGVGHFDVSPDGHLLALSWNDSGYDRIAVLDRPTSQLRTLANLPPGNVSALRFDHSGAHLAIELVAATAPRDVYVYDFETAGVARWTSSRLGDFSAARLVAPLTVRFPTWDRVNGGARTLSALLYRPRSAGPHPVLVMLGGADGPLRAQLDPFVQYCADELGVTVVQAAIRDGEPGILDLGALLAWLGVQPDTRRDRIALLGRGAGGTVALASLGLYGDRLRGAVDIDGTATATQVMPIRSPVLLVRGLEQPPLDAAAAEQLLWRLRGAKINSWFVAPRDRRETLASAGEQATAWRVIAQFVAAQLVE
jgi:dipeptidyl aminopeptidase/acylaminoacyl peptidase